jgi:hypothetical protein
MEKKIEKQASREKPVNVLTGKSFTVKLERLCLLEQFKK